MDIDEIPPRAAVGVGALALIPAIWYAFGRPDSWGYVTALSVVIIITSLYLAFEPVVEEQNGDASRAR